MKEKQIRESNISVHSKYTAPASYEAYLYKISLEKKGKDLGFYIGYHKGHFVYGEYWHSSISKKPKCVKFRKLCRDESVHLKYELLDYGSATRMTVEEYELLKKADPRNNPLCYNDSVGSPAYKRTDNVKIKNMSQLILGGEKYLPIDVNAEDIYEEYKKNQVRAEENSMFEDLREIVDINQGRVKNLKLWKPIVLAEIEPGVWKLIDGNTRVKAVCFSKHGSELPAIHIPFEDVKDWSAAELYSLGNFLNPRREERSQEEKKKDAIKEILSFAEKPHNMDVEDPCHIERLEMRGWSNKDISSIVGRAVNEWEKKERANGVWIDWSEKGWKPILNPIQEWLESTGRIVVGPMSTGKYNQESITEAEQLGGNGSDLIVFMHHPNPKAMDSWTKVGENGEPSTEDKKVASLRRYFEPLGSKVTFIQLPFERVSDLVSPSKFWESTIGKNFLHKYGLDLKK